MVTKVLTGINENEARDLWGRYRYAAEEAQKVMRQAQWNLEVQYELPIDEYDPDTFHALEETLKAARAEYRECHRLELQYMRLLQTF